MVWAGLQRLQIRSRGVAAIEHQRDMSQSRANCAISVSVRLANNAASFWFRILV